MSDRYSFFLLSLFTWLSINSTAQLSVNPVSLSFGNVYENSPDSLLLTISNNTGSNVTVTNIKFYDTYGIPAFSTNTNWFIINDNSSADVWIKFSPRHNIFHNSQLVIENDGLRGDVTVDVRGQGKYSNQYYNLSENLSEENLKTILGAITSNGYQALGYNLARDSMYMFIDNEKENGQGASQNTLECVYTGREAVGYTDRTDCQNNYSFNTEHTFPQTFFSSAEPMRSDLHHLFPTDDLANNQRGNNPFGVVSNSSWSVGGSKSDGFTFEPRDLQKGVVARSLFYFVLRYQNYNSFVTSQESVLRTWFWNFMPTTADRTRNDAIFFAQNNRNPFIDYPVFLERIHSITSNSVAPVVSLLDIPEDTIIYGTIPVSTPVTYNFVVVNNGNVSVSFTNFALSNPALTFATAANDTTLAPGEGLNIGITCFTTNVDSIRAFLSFNTNASGHVNVSVPIFINDNIFTMIGETENIFQVFPNPAHDFITLSAGNASDIRWLLSDITGKSVQHGDSRLIDVSSVSRGIYILKVMVDGSAINRKIILH